MFLDYDDLGSSTEDVAWDMVTAYHEFVNGHYKTVRLPSRDRFSTRPYYQGFCDIASELIQHGKDPLKFISYHFENWRAYNKSSALDYVVGNGASENLSMQHSRQFEVIRVHGRAGGLGPSLCPGNIFPDNVKFLCHVINL